VGTTFHRFFISRNNAVRLAITAGTLINVRSIGEPQTELNTFAATIPAIENKAA